MIFFFKSQYFGRFNYVVSKDEIKMVRNTAVCIYSQSFTYSEAAQNSMHFSTCKDVGYIMDGILLHYIQELIFD